MKASTTLLALVALTITHAAAVPAAEAEAKHHGHGRLGFCGAPGTPCLGGRDAEPEPGIHYKLNKHKHHHHHHHHKHHHLKHAHPRLGFCGAPGTPCLGGRNAEEAPESTEEGACGVPGEPCNTVKRAADAISDALEEARKHSGEGSFCVIPGGPCDKAKSKIDEIADKTRHAYAKVWEREAAAEADADPEARGRLGFCGAPGTPCLGGRNAEPEAEAAARGRLGFCGAPGTPCLGGRDALPEAKKHHKHHGHGRLGFCGAPGTPCLGGRDAEAIGDIIKANDPSFLKKECFKPGNECHTLVQLQKAFQGVKKDGEAAKQTEDHSVKLAHCGEKGAKCGPLTKAHHYAMKKDEGKAKEWEQKCESPSGLCTETKRELGEIEDAINDAVASLNDEEE